MNHNIEIIKADSRSARRLFASFGNTLYKDSAFYVPDLEQDILDTFSPEANGAYEFCESQLFLAMRDGDVVGRVAAIINHRANETWHTQNVRFSYLDFIDDSAVADALLQAVERWGRDKGMTACQGPMGFTDFDKEGMLVEGFDEMGSMTSYYNAPYYPQHMERMGYVKEADWVHIRVRIPEETPERFIRVSEMGEKRFGLRTVPLTGHMLFKEGYGKKIFDLLNEAYSPLFGFSKLSDRQIEEITSKYFKLIDMTFVALVVDSDDNVVGIGVTMGSLSHALRKSGGKLLPLGWWHLLRSLRLKMEDTVEMILIAVAPRLQGRGVNALFFRDLIPKYNKAGFTWAETAPQLETNHKELNQWDVLNPTFPKRRRCYSKRI